MPAVKEVRLIVWVPQRGSNTGVELPQDLPTHEYMLKDLEPLGWIKTQAQDLPHLAPADVAAHAKTMAAHPEWGANSICITAPFTPGSVSLAAHTLSVAGFEWGRKASPADAMGPAPGFNTSMVDKAQLLLSDRILGTTLVPTDGAWNFGLSLSAQWTPTMKYSLQLAPPAAFWDEIHRPQNFLTFAGALPNDENAVDWQNSLA